MKAEYRKIEVVRTNKGSQTTRIVIPQIIATKLNLKKDDYVKFIVDGSKVMLMKAETT